MAQARLTLAGATVLACVAAAGCGASPTGPAPPVQAQSARPQGLWKGMIEIKSCSGKSGACRGEPEAFALRLDATGDGVLQIDTKVWSIAPPLALTVTAASSGDLTAVRGSSDRLDAEVMLSSTGDSLAGTVRYTLKMNAASGPANKEGRILYALRDTTAYGARFQGNWTGFITRTECSGDCAWDTILGNSAIELMLSQTGSALSGNWRTYWPVSGTAAGNAMNLTTRHAIPASACRAGWDTGTYCLVEMDLTAAVDSLDRLTGAATYRAEGVDERNRPFALTGRVDLSGLVRWP